MQAKQFQLPIFNPGKKIEYQGQIYTIDHIRINGHSIKIKFKEIAEEVDSEKVTCEFTNFVLK